MSRESLTAGVLGGLAGGIAGGVGAGIPQVVVGVLIGVGVGVVAAAILGESGRRRALDVSRQLRGWVAAEREHHAVAVRGGDASWRELGAALNEVGALLDRHRDEMNRVHPWRTELVDSLVGPALLFDHDGYLVAANETARGLLRIGAGAQRATVVQALGSAVLADAVGRAQRTKGLVEVDAEVRDRQVHASMSAIGDEILVILADRTRERRVEELRRNFVVNASHELKTPATSIQTLSEALEITAERDPGRVPDLVARLREEAERLVRIVHDLLNLRRLEEQSEAQRVPVDLTEVARGVLAELQDRADARGITLALAGPEQTPIAGDPDDLRLVIRNLVANAIQYNRDGGDVDVRITRSPDEVTIEVADTGIGIPQQDLHRVFERFYRVDVARSRQTGGTGLGLSIVRHAVERHRGTIRVDSLLGGGTTFTVVLPTE